MIPRRRYRKYWTIWIKTDRGIKKPGTDRFLVLKP
jgi:hypothetical protein